MKGAKVDLHMHTQNSDGQYSVEELVNYIKGQRISFFSITDHDYLTEIDFKHKYPAIYVPGVEISANYADVGFHLLCYLPILAQSTREQISYESRTFTFIIDNDRIAQFRQSDAFASFEKMLVRLRALRIERALRVMSKEEVEQVMKKTHSIGRNHFPQNAIVSEFYGVSIDEIYNCCKNLECKFVFAHPWHCEKAYQIDEKLREAFKNRYVGKEGRVTLGTDFHGSGRIGRKASFSDTAEIISNIFGLE